MGGGFTTWPGRDSHGTPCLSAELAVSYPSAARPPMAGRATEAETGAPPAQGGSLYCTPKRMTLTSPSVVQAWSPGQWKNTERCFAENTSATTDP